MSIPKLVFIAVLTASLCVTIPRFAHATSQQKNSDHEKSSRDDWSEHDKSDRHRSDHNDDHDRGRKHSFVRDEQPKYAEGSVRKSNFHKAVGAQITVTCNGNSTDAMANHSGYFHAAFEKGECPKGKTVQIVATLNGEFGAASTTSDEDQSIVVPTIRLAPAAGVPEFGMFTGAIALFGSAGAFVAIKKRA